MRQKVKSMEVYMLIQINGFEQLIINSQNCLA